MAKISTILPVYNGEQYLEKSIGSILAQTFVDYELIIVDDGSTDCSGSICDEYANRDNRIKVIHKKNEGLICARITGIEAASGDYICFVDADDWVEDNFLEILLAPMVSESADIVVSGCVNEVGNVSNKIENLIPSGTYEGGKLIEVLYPQMLWYGAFYQFGILPYMCNKIFRKELLKYCYKDIDTKIYDGEDVAVTYPYLLSAKKIVVIGDCLYHYQIHEGSMSSKKDCKFYENVSRLYLHLNKMFCSSPHYDILIPQLNQYMRFMIWLGTPEEERDKERYYFPYRKVERGSSIILYGAGRVGIRYYRQMRETKYCTVILWTDKNYRKLSEEGLLVEAPEEILKRKYDYVVIANAKAKIQTEIKKYLLELGVNERQIILGEAEE